MNSTRIHTILSLLNLKGIGPAFIKKYELLIKDEINAQLDLPSLLSGTNKNNFTKSEIEEATQKAFELLELTSRLEIKIIDLFDEAYPQRLKEMKLKWPLIYCKGNVTFENKTLGIIGNRQSTTVGEAIAERMGNFFSDAGCVLINRLTKGIDAAAIGSNKVKQKTIGVLSGGLAYDEHKTLWKDQEEEANRILDAGGGLISTFEPKQKQDQYTAISYCTLQAALSDALVLAQSKIDGEARYALGVFSKWNRPLGGD